MKCKKLVIVITNTLVGKIHTQSLPTTFVDSKQMETFLSLIKNVQFLGIKAPRNNIQIQYFLSDTLQHFKALRDRFECYAPPTLKHCRGGSNLG